MKILHKYILASAIIMILAPVFYITITTGQITSTDWVFRHSEWIRQYLRGDFSMLSQYPPLFHFLMLPFMAVNFPMQYFQIIFAILNASVILYFMRKMDGENPVILMAMFMATSLAYLQTYSALHPQALDLIMFLPAISLYLKGKYSYASIGIFLLLVNHSAGLIFWGIFLVHSFITKRYGFLKYLVVLAVIMAIPYYFWTFNITTPVWWDAASQAEWDAQYFTPFWKPFILSGIFIWMLLPLAAWRKRRFNITEIQLFYIIWALAFIPLAFLSFGIWRAVSFSIVPLAMFATSVIKNE